MPGQHEFTFTVDGDEVVTAEKELTAIQIMELAGIDPETNYLIEIKGANKVSYKENPNDPIKIHEKSKFVTNFMGPTPVA